MIIGRQSTDSTVALCVMSTEALFAVLEGWLIASASLSAVEFFGCVLAFAAVPMVLAPRFSSIGDLRGGA